MQNDPSLETPLSLEQILYESESAVDTWRDDAGSQIGMLSPIYRDEDPVIFGPPDPVLFSTDPDL